MFKNVASQKVAVYAWDNAAGSEKTGDAANITAQISIDGGATAATDDTNPTELDAADAPGIYIFDMTQAETNGDLIVISPTSSTGDVVLRPAIIYTQAPADACLFTGGTVWVDPTGTNSTDLPYGSAPYPTSTIANGKTIADALNIQRINITGVISLVAAMEHYELIGSGNIDVTDIVNINSQSVEHSTLRDLTITGIGGNAATIADQTRYSNCLIYAHTNINGVVQGGSLGGACSIRDTGYALFTDVFFGQGAPCTLTVQAPTVCNIINMRGTLTISGMDGGALNITLTDGSFVIIDNTCTAGTITLTGIGTVTDNSGGGCTVIKLADTPTVLTEATNALIATAQADITDILEDTNELQTNWAVGGSLSTALNSINGVDLFDSGKGTYNYPESLLDEVIDDQNDRDFSDGNIGNWVVSNGGGSGTLTYDATALGFAGESGDDKQAMLTSDTDNTLAAALNLGTYATLTANKLHRFSAKVAVPAANSNKLVWMQTSGFTQSNSVTAAPDDDTWTDVTLYFYVDADVNGSLYIGFVGNPADTDKMYIDDITVKPVDTSWKPYGGNTLALDETNDLFTITYVNADYGAYLNIADSTDFSRDLVVTNSYRVTVYDAQAVNGDVKISVVEVGDTELGSVTLVGDAAPVTATFDFTASNATTNRLQLDGIGATEVVKFSRITVTENICSYCIETLSEDVIDRLDAMVGDILDGVIEGAYTVQDCLKVMLAYMASKASGGGTTEVRFRDTADTKDRITMTVDRNGNRSAIDVDVT